MKINRGGNGDTSDVGSVAFISTGADFSGGREVSRLVFVGL